MTTRVTNFLAIFAAVFLGAGCKFGRPEVNPEKDFRDATLVFLATYEGLADYKVVEVYKSGGNAQLIPGATIKIPTPPPMEGERNTPKLRIVYVFKSWEEYGFGPFYPQHDVFVNNGRVTMYDMTLEEFRKGVERWSR